MRYSVDDYKILMTSFVFFLSLQDLLGRISDCLPFCDAGLDLLL